MTSASAHEFDFIYGRWNVLNRKIRDHADPECREWVEFDATSEAFPILGGGGHIDLITVPNPPDGPSFEGMTLRLFDPADNRWRIWWSSTRTPGTLDPPMSGGFDGRHAVFFGEGIVADRPIRLRFDWHADAMSPRWEQAFSFDDGDTWTTNWVMTLTRLG